MSFMEHADGRWREIIIALGGVSPDQLTNRHQPCPACGGRDRFRWDSDDGKGSAYCSQCGGRDRTGGGMDGMGLLERITGKSFRDLAREIEAYLGVAPPAPRARRTTRPFRQAEKPPIDAPPPERRGMQGRWCYRNANGEQLFWVCRFATSGGGKRFQNALWLDGGWHFPSRQRDAFDTDWPKPLPLYGLDRLAAAPPQAPVILPEGEKSVDAAHLYFGHAHPCIGFRNGAKSCANTDFSPLTGRHIILLPDNDADGEEFVRRLTIALRSVAVASISVCRPPADAPPKWDIADALDWSTEQVDAWLATAEPLPETAIEPAVATVEPEVLGGLPATTRRLTDSDWGEFLLLGFDDSHYYYRSNSAGRVDAFQKSQHTKINLLSLAPLDWWTDRFPRTNADGVVVGANWDIAASELFAAQRRIGVYDPERIRGVGAWWDNSRSVVNLGDMLVIDGVPRPVIDGVPDSRFLYQRSAPLDMDPSVDPLSDAGGAQLFDLVAAFLWETPSHGMLTAGWLFCAPVCGCLKWRPHLWVTAPAGSGKSTLLTRVIQPAIGPILKRPLGNSTEAGIRQGLGSDARPVMFDEAESNQERDALRIQNVLGLARNSSSDGDGEIMKGTVSGGGMTFAPRSMFLFSSVNTATVEQADKTRISKANLINPTSALGDGAHAQWAQLQDSIESIITDGLHQRLMSRACRATPLLLETARMFSAAAAKRLGSQRAGDQHGTLCAGAWCLSNSRLPTPDEVEGWLTYYTLDAINEDAASDPDENSCRSQLLQYQLRVESGGAMHTRTILELIGTAGAVSGPAMPVEPADARAALGRYGVKVADDGRIIVSNTAKALSKAVFKGTPWAANWPEALQRLPGATRGGSQRFAEIGVSRATIIPID